MVDGASYPRPVNLIPFDLIRVGENPLNKVEEGVPAKVTQRIKFHLATALRRVSGERIS